MMKRNGILFTGKNAFSLMEVLIATALLSVVMISLFQIKSNNIFILEKSLEEGKKKDYLIMSMDTQEYQKRNKNVYLDKLFNVQDDDLRKELKEVKIKIEDEILDTREMRVDDLNFKISEFKTSYSFEKGLKKDIYRFKIEL